jgi:mRNA-degrading endonuclease toxin of MazEF toxin-antitoxin module
MRLPLYCSTSKGTEANLVGLQHPALYALPTQLVCPLCTDISLTPLREKIRIADKEHVVACDLIRPINRKTLRPMGELDPETSARIIATFHLMLAQAE